MNGNGKFLPQESVWFCWKLQSVGTAIPNQFEKRPTFIPVQPLWPSACLLHFKPLQLRNCSLSADQACGGPWVQADCPLFHIGVWPVMWRCNSVFVSLSRQYNTGNSASTTNQPLIKELISWVWLYINSGWEPIWSKFKKSGYFETHFQISHKNITSFFNLWNSVFLSSLKWV